MDSKLRGAIALFNNPGTEGEKAAARGVVELLAKRAGMSFDEALAAYNGTAPETEQERRVRENSIWAAAERAKPPRPDISRLDITDIDRSNRLRGVNEAAVADLAKSMASRGLINPIWVTVSQRDEYKIAIAWRLVAGLHRLAAAELLGWTEIDVRIIDKGETECRLLEIAENLHRNELTPGQRREQLAEWIRLTEAGQSSQVGTNESKRDDGRGHRQQGGVNAAARELGVKKSEAHRAVNIMESVTPDAVEAAKVAGIWDNTSAMEKVASYADADQVEAVAAIVAEKTNPKRKAKPAPAEPEPVTRAAQIEPEPEALSPAEALFAAIGDRLNDLSHVEALAFRDLVCGYVAGRTLAEAA